MLEIRFNLSGVRLILSDLSPSLAERFRDEWHEYLANDDASIEADLQVRCTTSDVEVRGERFDAEMTAELDDDRARFELPEGSIELDGTGSATLQLASSSQSVQFFAASNLLCAALAWRLPERGIVLLHAAGIVVKERGFLLVGASGAGKSTWAELAREAGARFLSDDMLFVDVSTTPAEVLSMPFRADHPRTPGPARWPLGAILLPVHGEKAELAPARRLEVLSRVTANLLFVSDRPGGDPRLAPLLDRLIAGAPAYHLTFGLNQGFLECLEQA
jgi:hypothetical protein